jgi:hypothetical protein
VGAVFKAYVFRGNHIRHIIILLFFQMSLLVMAIGNGQWAIGFSNASKPFLNPIAYSLVPRARILLAKCYQ